MTASISARNPQGDRLRFDRTVDRRLLHRRTSSEVFLTDAGEAGERGYRAGARLPASHSYYTDHAGHSALDPMLLLECARQAETYGAHVHLGVGDDTKFILRSWSMRLPGLFHGRSGTRSDLSMSVTTDRPVGRAAPARSGSYEIEFALGDERVGDVRMDVGYLSSAAYSHVRTLRRGTPPVSSDDVGATPATVAPAAVARTREINTLLADPERTGEGLRTRVRLPVDNPSMFEHAQDHLPGMVLTEAARQLCLLAGAELLGRPATTTTVIGFDLEFSQFAELDAPTTITAEPGADGRFGIAIVQHGECIAHGTMDTVEVPASLRGTR